MSTEREDNDIAADVEARRQALDTLASLIVQAPAGSGKTGLLTQRFLALLAQVQVPEEILAITFTRKAANEMRARITGALARARDDSPPASDYERTTWDLARSALARSDAKGWELTSNPNRLGVYTIDGFCARLASRTPVLSRAGAQAQVAENARPLYDKAARALLRTLDAEEPATAHLENLVLHLDNNLPRCEGLLSAMLATRDHWLPRLADPENPRLQREALEEALDASVARELERLAGALPENLQQELVTLAHDAAEELSHMHGDGPTRACLGLDALPPASVDGVE
ncbi:MAG: UvrD-helicase domain-containing protein, partial [Pseudomonadota bacterium]